MRPYILTSKFNPTDDNIEFLNHGPSYIPFTNISRNKFMYYVNRFVTKLQWHLHLRHNQYNPNNRFGILNSNRRISGNQLTPAICNITSLIINSSKNIINNNLVPFQPSAIPSFDNLSISKADKGSNWVIQSRDSYIDEGVRQLSDSTFYKFITKEKAKFNKAAINRLIDHLYNKKYINLSEKRFLYINTYKNRSFYLLPKIHKEHWTIPNIQPKGRPIVNCRNSESYAIAIFIDHWLQPLVAQQSSYIRDSFHLVGNLSEVSVRPTSILFSFDVEQLYTNIPIEGALTALQIIFNRFPDPKRPDSVILNLLKIILFGNDFTFNNSLYLQIKGVAMGQRFAPSVANLYLAIWEERLLSSTIFAPLIWFRYIDDIFGIWNHSLADFHHFFHIANNIDPNIKLTFEYSFDKMIFLDVLINKNIPNLNFSVSFKSYNSHTIISPDSCNPSHTFRGVIYSQIYRWALLSSNRTFFNDTCKKVFPLWRKRGYTLTLMKKVKKDILHRLNFITNWERGFSCCTSCNICHLTSSCKSVNINNFTFLIPGNFDCNTTFCIYLVKCLKCNLFYVGHASKFKKRIYKHANNIISHNSEAHFHQHFRSCGLNNFRSFVIDVAKNKDNLFVKENKYIKLFNTARPNGLNTVTYLAPKLNLVLPFHSVSEKLVSNIRNICTRSHVNIQSSYTTNNNLQNILFKK